MAISVQLIVALIFGVGIGLIAGYLTFPAIREAKRLRIQLDETLQEQEKYKRSVSAHFRKTGELVGEMTRSYAAVYDHLASGARNFATEAASEMTLPFGPSPGMLASPVIDAGEDMPAAASSAQSPDNGLAPSTIESAGNGVSSSMESAELPSPMESAELSSPMEAPIEATDAALDGSMLAAEVFVGEAGLDSSSETSTSDSARASDSHKA